MRIALLGGGVQPIPPTGYGAVERILADFQEALRRAGHDAVVVNRVRHKRMRDEYPFAWELPRLLRGERFDALHANTPVVANRLALSGEPFVYTSHSRHWFYRERLSHRWGYWLERRAVRRATAVVALTPRVAEAMRRAAGRATGAPLDVVPFGVDSERFAPAPGRRDGRTALGVGVVLPFKRWELAARAVEGTGTRLRIAGPVPSASYADTVRRAGPSVELLGEVDESTLTRLYAESDLLLHPSAVEVLSAAVVQAFAAGLPVIGGPALSGVVDPGRTGWVCPDADSPGFVAGMRERLIALERDAAQRRAMAEAARAEALSRYAWPEVVRAHLPLYSAAARPPA